MNKRNLLLCVNSPVIHVFSSVLGPHSLHATEKIRMLPQIVWIFKSSYFLHLCGPLPLKGQFLCSQKKLKVGSGIFLCVVIIGYTEYK